MADFVPALAELLLHEGGWVDDAADRGGETFRGISRRHFPAWPGWRRIDAARRRAGFPDALARDRTLKRMVAAFYKTQFWDRFSGDSLTSQALACELLDTSVHLGLRRAIRLLQQGLNLLNRNARDYPDLRVDGLLGPHTLQALETCLSEPGAEPMLLKLLNILQGSHYVALLQADPAQERYARGWFGRT
jgi:lysozyme family protein